MKQRWRQIGLKICCILFLGVSFMESYARPDEWAGWSSVKVTRRLTDDFQWIGIAGFRMREDFQVADRARLNLGGRYKVARNLSLDAAYELHYSHLNGGGWEFRHRYYVGALLPVNVADLRIAVRERFQQTFVNGEVESVLRSQLRLAYAQGKWRVSPFLALEVFQPVGGEAFFSVAQMRYRPGVRMQLSSLCSLDLYYCRQHTERRDRNVLGVELGIHF